ncbi:hypothetical protein [Pelagibacterium mangrovi]|uniref:hypothetical protein n=1 Tax=Pelagibacterium mangrovi TaxID=3119828 RepID=UPI002FC75F82
MNSDVKAAEQEELSFEVVPRSMAEPLHEFIEGQHYRRGRARGRLIACYLRSSSIAQFASKYNAIDGRVFAGALVLGRGCSYSSPVGRSALVEANGLNIDLSELSRGEAVNQLGLTMVNRVAVLPGLQGRGIATGLAYEARRLAPTLFPAAKFIEVMTARSVSDAQATTRGEFADCDFFQRAGYAVAPTISSIQWRQTGNGFERTGMVYYYASILR